MKTRIVNNNEKLKTYSISKTLNKLNNFQKIFFIDNSGIDITFGKYKDIRGSYSRLMKDKSYCIWLHKQSWFKDKYPSLYWDIIKFYFKDEFIKEIKQIMDTLKKTPGLWEETLLYSYGDGMNNEEIIRLSTTIDENFERIKNKNKEKQL